MSGTVRRTVALSVIDGGVEQPLLSTEDPDDRDWTASQESQVALSAGAAASAVNLAATHRVTHIKVNVPVELAITEGANTVTVQVPLPPGVLPGNYQAIDLPFESMTALTIRNTHATLDGVAHVFSYGS